MTYRLTLALPDDLMQQAKEDAKKRGITITSLITQAIENDQFLRQELRRGTKILFEDTHGTIRELWLQRS